MAYVCLNCFEVYKDSIKDIRPIPYGNNQKWLMCPKINCYGEIIEVDELMLPIIINLNKKGYKTKNCCSGHYYDPLPNCYIQFDDNIKIPSIPKNCYIENPNEKNIVLRNDFGLIKKDTYLKNHSKLTDLKLINMILDNTKELLKWSEELPDIKKVN